jgi:glycosyltransferase involved in cell wall biosynthesis
MKILELTNFSAGGCGVWTRVKNESKLLAEKGHEVKVFSSNFVKGSKLKAQKTESLEKFQIQRFPAKRLGGEGFLKWEFEKEALEFKPDLIIAHSYRQLHTTKALKLKKIIGCKVFLVTHAPFDRSSTRNLLSKIAVSVYDSLIGPNTLNVFDKIIPITKWELPYLKELEVEKEKIVYIPNGIPKEFFGPSKKIETRKIIYCGRVSHIKNIEVVIRSINKIKNNLIKFEIFGPVEQNYLQYLNKLIKHYKLERKISITDKHYDSEEQKEQLDSSEIFILPSKSEGMPQTLIEAMARGKIILASDNKGARDIIEEGINGFLFKNNDSENLAITIEKIYAMKKDELRKIKSIAKKTAQNFSWEKLIPKMEALITN